MSEPAYRTYLFQYFHNGSWWTFEMSGLSEEDAKARMNKLPLAQYLGTLEMKVPVRLGWFVRLAVWYRNHKPFAVKHGDTE